MACDKNAHKERLEQTAFQRLQDMNMISPFTRQDIEGDIYVDGAMNFYSIEELQKMVNGVNDYVGARAVMVYQNKTTRAKFLRIRIPTNMVNASIKNEDTLPDVPVDPNGQFRLFSPDSTFIEENEEDTVESDTLGQEESLKSLIAFKSELIEITKNRINAVIRNIDKLRDELKKALITQENYDKRIRELKELMVDLKSRISGRSTLEIEGLYNEIQSVKKMSYLYESIKVIFSDLARAEELADSTDANDILEALHILQFYSTVNNLTDKEINQMLAKIDLEDVAEDMIIAQEEELSEEQKKENLFLVLNMIATKAEGIMYKVSKAETSIIVAIFNHNIYIRRMFPERFIEGQEKPFDEDEVFEKLKGMDDARWYDSLVNLTSSLSGNITLYEQVMFTEALSTKIQEEYLSREVEEKVTGMVKKLKSELKKLKIGYDIFIDKSVNELKRRFSSTYYAEFDRAISTFRAELDKALKQDTIIRGDAMIIEAYRKYVKWAQKNVFIIDNDSFPELSGSVPTIKSDRLKELLGEKGYENVIGEQMKLNLEFNEALAEKEAELMMKYNIQNIDNLDETGIFELEQWKRTNSPDYFMKTYLNPNLLSKSDGTLSDRVRAGLVLFEPIIDENTGLPTGDTRPVAIHPISDYAYMVPRKKKFNLKTGTESDTETGYYSDNFKIIENNPVMLEFYNIMVEAMRRIHSYLPYEMTKDMNPYSLWLLNTTILEILKKSYKDTAYGAAIILLFQRFFVFMGNEFGRKMSITKPETGSYYNRKKINASDFISHAREIKNMFAVEFSKLKEQLDEEVSEVSELVSSTLGKLESKTRKIKKRHRLSRNLRVKRSMISNQGIAILKNMLKVTGGDVRLVDKNIVSVGEIVYSYATMKVVESKSFNLPKMIIALSHAAAAFAGAAQIEATQLLFQEGARKIEAPAKNLKGEISQRTERGVRKWSGRKIQSHMDRIVWGQFKKDATPNGWSIKLPILSKQGREWVKQFDAGIKREKMSGAPRLIGSIEELLNEKVFDESVTAGLKDIMTLLENGNKQAALKKAQGMLSYIDKKEGKDSTIYDDIEDVKNSIETIGNPELVKTFQKGKEEVSTYLTVGSLGTGLLSFWRFAGLAVNIGAMYTNVAAGMLVNATMAQLGTRFSADSYYRAVQVVAMSPLKYLSWSWKYATTDGANKTSVLMSRYKILQDVSNELQKAENRTAFSGLISNPYVFVVRGEFMVQSPIMIAMLMDYIIEGKDENDNVITSSAWDAMDKNGKLKPGFDTPHNIQTWEQAATKEASIFIGSVSDAIVGTHGDYSKYSGTLAGENQWVQAAFMFKKWMAMQIHQRRAGIGMVGRHTPHANLITGQKDFVGRHAEVGLGYGAGIGAMTMANFISISAASIGGGAIFGAAAAMLFGKGPSAFPTNMKSIKHLGTELINIALGPLTLINYVAGRELIPFIAPRNLTETERGNIKASAAALAQQLAMYMATHLLANLILGKCEDEKEMGWYNPKKYACRGMTLLYNKSQSLAQEMSSLDIILGYTDVKNTIVPVGRISDIIRLMGVTWDAVINDDVYFQGGKNEGKHKVWEQFKRVFNFNFTTDMALGLERGSREMWMSPPMEDFYMRDEYKVEKLKWESKKNQLRSRIKIEEGLTTYKGRKISFKRKKEIMIATGPTKTYNKAKKKLEERLSRGDINQKGYDITLFRYGEIAKETEENLTKIIDEAIDVVLNKRMRKEGILTTFPTEEDYWIFKKTNDAKPADTAKIISTDSTTVKKEVSSY